MFFERLFPVLLRLAARLSGSGLMCQKELFYKTVVWALKLLILTFYSAPLKRGILGVLPGLDYHHSWSKTSRYPILLYGENVRQYSQFKYIGIPTILGCLYRAKLRLHLAQKCPSPRLIGIGGFGKLTKTQRSHLPLSHTPIAKLLWNCPILKYTDNCTDGIFSSIN